MKFLRNLAGRLAGAIALNILHESLKHEHNNPRIDLVGEEAITKGSLAMGVEPPAGKELYQNTLTADLISNAVYYSLIGSGRSEHFTSRGLVMGALAGFCALALTKPLGLDDMPINKTNRTKILTVSYYTFGGLVAGMVMSMLSKSK